MYFTCSASLLRASEVVLNVVFDFKYKQLILSSLPILSKIGCGEKAKKTVFVKLLENDLLNHLYVH